MNARFFQEAPNQVDREIHVIQRESRESYFNGLAFAHVGNLNCPRKSGRLTRFIAAICASDVIARV